MYVRTYNITYRPTLLKIFIPLQTQRANRKGITQAPRSRYKLLNQTFTKPGANYKLERCLAELFMLYGGQLIWR